jgi:hypothetical protein
MGDLIPQTAEAADQNIVGYIGSQVTNMGIVIYRGTAPIKPNFARFKGLKFLQFPTKGVKQVQWHGTSALFPVQ